MPFRFIDIHTHHIQYDSDCFSIICAPLEKDNGRSLYSWGIHPCFIQNPDKQLQEVELAMKHERWIALGESGLDKLSLVPLPLQISLFESQIILSEQYNKPLIIHCVKAWAELIAIRREMKPVQPWIIHGFRGKKELAGQLLREGFFLSFGQYYHEEALRKAWPDRLSLETDEALCPIADLYCKASAVLDLPMQDLFNQIRANCVRMGLIR